jgi:tRNASer (uridine44-2'-O)-methyltransferase
MSTRHVKSSTLETLTNIIAKGKSEEVTLQPGSFCPQWMDSSGNSRDSTDISDTAVLTSEESVNKLPAHSTGNAGSGVYIESTGLAFTDLPTLQPPGKWHPILWTPCDFEPPHFLHVMENQLRNPNITTSFLFRADILYDSVQDKEAFDKPGGGFVKWMKKEFHPREIKKLPADLKIKRTVVRKLVPRKPWVDPEIAQTVHFLEYDPVDVEDTETESSIRVKTVVVYIPHVDSLDAVPFYHPKVQAIALTHSYSPNIIPSGSLSISYQYFPDQMDSREETSPLADGDADKKSNRLQRTALNLLRIVHKHGNGTKAGYQKRVHHDQIVPQKVFQDTYSRLKEKYSQGLMDAWAEVTDPQKHVFEDLGIAAFLIEVWRDMYTLPSAEMDQSGTAANKPPFPGFVDVGCGNGVLVHILLCEGYDGWGFDARKRKSWEVLTAETRKHLHEGIFIPKPLLEEVDVNEVIKSRVPNGIVADDSAESKEIRGIQSVGSFKIHDGMFKPGTFIISNHADQLTAWTPLMAYLSDCPFISIPCCSHSLSGKLQRFYDQPPGFDENDANSGSSIDTQRLAANGEPIITPKLKQAAMEDMDGMVGHGREEQLIRDATIGLKKNKPEKGSIGPRKPGPSAYAGFTAHVMHLALNVGFQVRQEVLRIPSTRNLCVVGTMPLPAESANVEGESLDAESKEEKIAEVLQKEVGSDVSKAARDWVEGALGLTKAGKTSVKGAFGRANADQDNAELHEERTRRKHKTLGIESLDELDLIE